MDPTRPGSPLINDEDPLSGSETPPPLLEPLSEGVLALDCLDSPRILDALLWSDESSIMYVGGRN